MEVMIYLYFFKQNTLGVETLWKENFKHSDSNRCRRRFVGLLNSNFYIKGVMTL